MRWIPKFELYVLKVEQFELFWRTQVTYAKTTQTAQLLEYIVLIWVSTSLLQNISICSCRGVGSVFLCMSVLRLGGNFLDTRS